MYQTNTYVAVRYFVAATRAIMYDTRLVNFANQDNPIRVIYQSEQLISTGTINFLRAKNLEGYNIYTRPVGYEYVLLDDLSREVLDDLAELRPCALVETSANNYQAWLRLREVPSSREEAVVICHELADRFGADKASAEPDHIGRLPGFTNRKPKHQNSASQQFPFVKLHRYADRNADFHPEGGIVLNQSPTEKLNANNKQSRATYSRADDSQSSKDFAIACRMIREGLSDFEIENKLSDNISLPGRPRKSKNYVQITVRNARKAVYYGK